MPDLITETDHTFFGSNESAWHGKGIVKEHVTKQDLLDKIAYPIVKEPLVTTRGEKTTTYATIRSLADGSRIILGDKLGAGYQILQNYDFINGLDPMLQAGCEIETGGTLDEGRKIWTLLRLAGDMRVGKSDLIRRYFLASNDHTGKAAVRVGTTGIRVVCNNTLTMAHSDSDAFMRVYHGGNVLMSYDEAVKMVDASTGTFLAYGERLDILAASSINQADIDRLVKVVFFPKLEAPKDTASDKVKEKHESDAERLLKLQNQINEIFQTEPTITDHVDTAGTAYGAYQAVNYYLNHVQSLGAERRLLSLAWGSGRANDEKALSAAVELVVARR